MNLLKETRMLGCKLVNTLIDVNHKVRALAISLAMNKESKQRLVGKLIYLSRTRPDTVFCWNSFNFVHMENEKLVNAVVIILRYLNGAPRKELLFSKTYNLEVEANMDTLTGQVLLVMVVCF